MGKHNGKARTTGSRVGTALVNSAKKVQYEREAPLDDVRKLDVTYGVQGSKVGGFDTHKHTTDFGAGGTNMQSVIENNDLTELLTMVCLQQSNFITMEIPLLFSPFCSVLLAKFSTKLQSHNASA